LIIHGEKCNYSFFFFPVRYYARSMLRRSAKVMTKKKKKKKKFIGLLDQILVLAYNLDTKKEKINE